MALTIFSDVTLAAVSAVVPAQSVNLDDELEYYGGDPEKARRLSDMSGLVTRRVAPDGVTAADLCLQAAHDLLEASPEAKEEIGALIFVSHSADYLLPASAAILQGLLGLPEECATMDMNVGCAGFVKGMWVAAGLIQSGACSKVLLLVGDTPNRYQNPANRVTAPVFGDAGTAALLERNTDGMGMSFMLGSKGAQYEALVIPGGGSRIPPCPDDAHDCAYNQQVTDAKGNPWTLGGYCNIWMDGLAIYSFGVSVVPRHIRKHLDALHTAPEALNSLLLHQANKVIIESIAKRTGIPLAKVPYDTLPKYGNLGSSSIPALICEHYSASGKGADEGRANVMLCAFGAGLSWASCVLSLEKTHVLPVREFVKPDNLPDRDQRIAYWHDKFAHAKG